MIGFAAGAAKEAGGVPGRMRGESMAKKFRQLASRIQDKFRGLYWRQMFVTVGMVLLSGSVANELTSLIALCWDIYTGKHVRYLLTPGLELQHTHSLPVHLQGDNRQEASPLTILVPPAHRPRQSTEQEEIKATPATSRRRWPSFKTALATFETTPATFKMSRELIAAIT